MQQTRDAVPLAALDTAMSTWPGHEVPQKSPAGRQAPFFPQPAIVVNGRVGRCQGGGVRVASRAAHVWRPATLPAPFDTNASQDSCGFLSPHASCGVHTSR